MAHGFTSGPPCRSIAAAAPNLNVLIQLSTSWMLRYRPCPAESSLVLDTFPDALRRAFAQLASPAENRPILGQSRGSSSYGDGCGQSCGSTFRGFWLASWSQSNSGSGGPHRLGLAKDTTAVANSTSPNPAVPENVTPLNSAARNVACWNRAPLENDVPSNQAMPESIAPSNVMVSGNVTLANQAMGPANLARLNRVTPESVAPSNVVVPVNVAPSNRVMPENLS